MVEGARLESVYGLTPIPGSNPGLSASLPYGGESKGPTGGLRVVRRRQQFNDTPCTCARRARGGPPPRRDMGRALRKKAL